MPDANTTALPPVTVEFQWLDADQAATALTCRFTLNGIRHGVEVERKGFRFVTPEAWGFRRTADGGFVFWDVPAWK